MTPNLPMGSLVSYRYSRSPSLGIVLFTGKHRLWGEVAKVKWLHNKPITANEDVSLEDLVKIL